MKTNFKKTASKFSFGFTLVELITVISIITISAGTIFISYRQAGQQFALQRAANKLAQDIRKAQEMAMSAKEFYGEFPKGGYGIRFDLDYPGLYRLFADCNNNYDFDDQIIATSCANAGQTGDPYPEGVGDSIYFEGGVKISDFSPESGVNGPLTITFTPPDPVVRINGQDISQGPPPAVITLETPDGTKTKTVTVNLVGLIEVD